MKDCLGYRMKWYKFLVYFALIAGALLNAVSGWFILASQRWDIDRLFYEEHPSLKAVDTVSGILTVCCAMLGFVTWYALRGFKKSAPLLVVGFYLFSSAVSTVYYALVYFVADSVLETTDVVGAALSLAVGVLMAVANRVYFSKRKELFTS